VDVVTIASGTDYPDALAGGPFAAGLGPLLLVPATGTVPAAVTAEIQRLAPGTIVILGGTGAVSSGVEAQLADLGQTVRFAGSNRYDTAAQVAVATVQDLGGAETVILSSGEGFADSLAGGASAANQAGVLLLTRRSGLSPEAKAALLEIAPTRVQVLGGTGAVSDAVISSVKSTLPSTTVARVAGADRAATAAAISEVTFPTGTQETFLTNGWNYPDALAAAPLSWFWSTSVLLASTACAPAATVAEDARLAPLNRTAIGGTGAVSDAALMLKKC
jgi:putative cell wall-binding protein